MLILGSASPQRRKLMEQAGYQFRTISPRPSAERGVCSNCGPAELVVDLAVAKAVDVAAQLRASGEIDLEICTIIACDTVAECNGHILGKPKDEIHARQMLALLRGARHRVYSGLCVWPRPMDARPPAASVRLAVSELQMGSISDEQLDHYVASGAWQGKAGGFGLQDRPGWLQLRQGSESNVIGLPMELLAEALSNQAAN